MLKKKLILAAMLAGMMLAAGCGEIKMVYVSSDEGSFSTYTVDNFVKIADYLYYDKNTNIAYLWNDILATYAATIPSPYYAPNGKPYRYNPSSNTLEEIDS